MARSTLTEDRLDNLESLITTLSQTINDNIKQTNNRLKKVEEDLNVKTTTLDLEKIIAANLNEAIGKSIVSVLNYDKAGLAEMVTKALKGNRELIETSLNAVVKSEFDKDTLTDLLRDQFRSKLVRVLLSGVDGLVEKSLTDLRKDPTFNARLVVTVSDLIKEYTNA